MYLLGSNDRQTNQLTNRRKKGFIWKLYFNKYHYFPPSSSLPTKTNDIYVSPHISYFSGLGQKVLQMRINAMTEQRHEPIERRQVVGCYRSATRIKMTRKPAAVVYMRSCMGA